MVVFIWGDAVQVADNALVDFRHGALGPGGPAMVLLTDRYAQRIRSVLSFYERLVIMGTMTVSPISS